MTIIRGASSLVGLPPGLYINELAVPQTDEALQSDFVLGFVGDFDRGPVNQYVMVTETPTKRLSEIASSVLGSMAKANAGNALIDHLHRANVKKAAFVRILGAGYATASLTLQDRQGTPANTLKVSAKYPGSYANTFSVQADNGTNSNTFKLTLTSDFGIETYDNLTMDPLDARYAPSYVNGQSLHFALTDMNSAAATRVLAQPAVKAKTQLTGGNNGAAIAASDYVGTVDSGSGARTGLKLLEFIGNIVTDVAFADFTDATADAALATYAQKYNSTAYCGTGSANTVAAAVTNRDAFDTDFMQMVYGRFQSVGNQWTSGACLSAISHVIGNVEDSGIAVECTWVVSSDKNLDFTDYSNLYSHQVAAFQLKPSAAGDGTLAWRMANDYTLAKSDASGTVISDDENRKVNRRRLNSWIEKALESVAAPWQGKAMTKKMKDDAERRIRTYFDLLKKPVDLSQTSKFEDYSVTFNAASASIDQFVQDIKVKHYNTAEWVVLNFQGGTNVEVG
ncbi:phage tail protein [Bacillus sp. 3255]|uniref:phage tail protein n=1 Tax=Bacillus sp. 3255 TaxID=2817904 RepID=UPI00285F38D1|nr:phage tail protein [Bacillus sp. 3255]MDR6883023.1 hypothetical protein [Bacillus sp. 3255]